MPAAIFALGQSWLLVPRRSPLIASLTHVVARPSEAQLAQIAGSLVRTPRGRSEALALIGRPRGLVDGRSLTVSIARAVRRGQLVVLRDARAQPRVDASPGIAGQFSSLAASEEETTRPAPLELSEKSLMISRCPGEYAPRRGPLELGYLLRELSGQPVELTIRAADYPGETVLSQALDAGQTSDGDHDFEWDGRFAAGPEQGERVRPQLSPYLVELVHDDSYRDQASFIVVPPTVEILAVGDQNFATDREVMLPAPSVEAEASGDLADGIALTAGLLAHLRDLGEDRQVLIAGHTDAAGSDSHNLGLSERRAENVQMFCAGERDDWAAHSHDNATVADGQEVLRWIEQRFGWPCDPGPVDNQEGPQTAAGRDGFRARYAHEFDGEAGSGDAFVLADWQAFFDLYEQDLAARLGVAVDELAGVRERLVFCDPPILACGEHWPESGLDRAAPSRDDRRVELLCFHPEELPDPIGGDDPPGASIYTPGAYRWRPVEIGPGPEDLLGPCFELELAIDDRQLVPAGAALRLHGGPYDLRQSFDEAEFGEAWARFRFRGLATGVAYTLDFEAEEGEPTTLFEACELDAYIAGIGDDGAELPSIALASLPLVDAPEEVDGSEVNHGPMASEDLHEIGERDPELAGEVESAFA